MYTIFLLCKVEIWVNFGSGFRGNFLVIALGKLADKNNVADREVVKMVQLLKISIEGSTTSHYLLQKEDGRKYYEIAGTAGKPPQGWK